MFHAETLSLVIFLCFQIFVPPMRRTEEPTITAPTTFKGPAGWRKKTAWKTKEVMMLAALSTRLTTCASSTLRERMPSTWTRGWDDPLWGRKFSFYIADISHCCHFRRWCTFFLQASAPFLRRARENLAILSQNYALYSWTLIFLKSFKLLL